MLKQRIISTLKFFDLQDYPLTLLELRNFLLADIGDLKRRMNAQWELVSATAHAGQKTGIDEIAKSLETDCAAEVEQKNGMFCLRGKSRIINQRLANYIFGIGRERLIDRFVGGLRHIPFVRGAALGGSQAMGLNKQTSDIDLLIITEDKYMWLARTWVTVYFQILGARRHGRNIKNRFCLNHYLARPKTVARERNLYKAMEYARLRPLVYGQTISQFQQQNSPWIGVFFPDWQAQTKPAQALSRLQKFLEKFFLNRFGRALETALQDWQIARIKQGEFIFVTSDELSFHPQSRHESLLSDFFTV